MNEKSIWQKIYPITVPAAIILILLAIIKWQHNQLLRHQEQSSLEMKQLRDDIVRSQTELASKSSMEELAKQSNIDLSPIKEDLNKLNAEMKGISTVLVATPGTIKKSLPSDTTTIEHTVPIVVHCSNGEQVSCPDEFGYHSSAQTFKLNEPLDNKNVPFGEIQFRAWEARPWTLQVHPRTYSLTSILGEKENGQHVLYHKFTISVNGQNYPVTITNAKLIEEKPEQKFKFDPHLFLGFSGGLIVYPTPEPQVIPHLQLSLFSLGRVNNFPTWNFILLGGGLNIMQYDPVIVFSPVNYNMAPHLPLISNLYVTPSISWSSSQQLGVTLGVTASL